MIRARFLFSYTHTSSHLKFVSGRFLNCSGRTILLLGLALGLALPVAANPQNGTGRITGTVKRSTGEPVAQAIVAVAGPTNRSGMTDEDGYFEISGLAPGAYSVTVVRPGYVTSKRQAVDVKPDVATEVPFALAIASNETVVVTASRIETDIQSVPAAVSVVPANEIAAIPATNFGDLLRSVPGLNVVQTLARDINLASRQASPSLTNSQIALVDGRTIYSDFYNVIFWDMIPVNANDIKQIEVVRGCLGGLGTQCGYRCRQHHYQDAAGSARSQFYPHGRRLQPRCRQECRRERRRIRCCERHLCPGNQQTVVLPSLDRLRFFGWICPSGRACARHTQPHRSCGDGRRRFLRRCCLCESGDQAA